MTEDLLHSPLYEKQLALGARMGEVAGWEMPLAYRGVVDEANEVRSRAGVFDLTPLGRLRIRGDDSLKLLERLCSHDVARQQDDTVAQTLLLNDRGGIIDLCHLVRLADFWVLQTSAANRLKVMEILQQAAEGLAAKVDDQTTRTAMLGVAGPAAGGILDQFLPEKVSQLPLGSGRLGSFMLASYIVARVDFAGVWGLQVTLPNLFASQAWRYITEKAGANALRPTGVWALDVLRVEASLPVYGHEINETIDPYTAGLDELVCLDHDFVGASALRELAVRPTARVRAGLLVEVVGEVSFAPAIPCLGDAVLDAAGNEIGAITSATFSPAMGKVIAMAYLARSADTQGTLRIQGNGHQFHAKAAPMPFVS